MMNKEEQQISDQLIKNGLDSLRPESPEGSWELLAQRLEAGDTVSITEQDELLKDKLNGLEPVYNPQSWADLNARLNNEESDDIFYYRLDAHAPVSPTSNWAALAAKLELIAARRAAIYSFKFSEICVLASCLIVFWNFFPAASPEKEDESPVVADVQPLLMTTETVSSHQANRPLVVDVAQLALVTAEDEIDYAKVNRPTWTEATLPQVDEIAPRPAIAQTPIVVETVAIVKESATTVDAIPGIDVRLPDIESVLLFPPITQVETLKKKKPRSIYLRSFVSPWDFNQVITPEQAVNDIILERDNRISYGQSAGVLFDAEYRKHSMQYGVVYAIRSYIPTVLKDVEGFEPGIGPIERRDTNYSRIRFQTVSLPFSYQRELLETDRWRIAASAGVAANINIWATFRKSPTFDQDVLNWTRETPQPAAGARSPENSGIPVLDAKDLVYPEQGLLQGGSLLSNVSMSVSAGFLIERMLNEKFSVYVAPNFSRAIYYQKDSGAEPFNDRIHSNSIQFGTRILLGTRK